MTEAYKAPSPEHVARIFEALAAPLPQEEIKWRQVDKPTERGGKYFARYVAYIEAGFVRRLFDEVALGRWSLNYNELPVGQGDEPYAMRATITLQLDDDGVQFVSRSDVGQGKDWKQASTDAFKRAAVRFGVAHELYEMGPTWVPMDGDGKYAKPLEDPAVVAARKGGVKYPFANRNLTGTSGQTSVASSASLPARPIDETAPLNPDGPVPVCPQCEGAMWDNRVGKRNPKAPDFKCRDKSCDGVIWPPKTEKKATDDGPLPPARPIDEVVKELDLEAADELPF
jgi:hypothetical protein